MHFIGVDTSCYTTSLACVDQSQRIVCDLRTMLSVPMGERGLRQNDGVFAHVKNLERMMDELTDKARGVCAVGVSAAPREAQGSYMPVFEVGRMAAQALAGAWRARLYLTTHQHGHIRAALIGNEALGRSPFLALHLSGGTTELLQAVPEAAGFGITRLGGSLDLHAGQLIDRVGVALGESFPAGPALDKLACGGGALALPSSVQGMDMSFSGALTRLEREIQSGLPREAAAATVFHLLSRTLAKVLIAAETQTGISDVLVGGGVSASETLRTLLHTRLQSRKKTIRLHWAAPAYGGDNAVGVALLAMESIGGKSIGQNH